MASAGYWGKLPTFPDFVKHNSGSDEVQDFDKWLNEGMYSARQKFMFDWDQVYLNSGSYNFIFPYGTKILTGVIFPGKDKSRRLSPFTRFLLAENGSGLKTHLFPLYYSGFYENFTLFLSDALSCSTNEEIAGKSNNIPVLDETESGIKEADYFNFLYSAKTGSISKVNQSSLIILFYNLISVLASFNSLSPGEFKLGLRFPVPGNNFSMVCFWLQCTLIIAGTDKLPYLFWSTEEESGGYCYLFLRKPGTHFFPVLLKPGLEQDDIVKLDTEGNIEKAKNNIHNDLLAILENPDSPLVNIIQFLTNKFSME